MVYCISNYVEGIDFDLPSNESKIRVNFPAGNMRANIEIKIIDDFQFEPAETFRLTVEVPASSAQLGVSVGEKATTKVTIDNDEGRSVVVLYDDVILYHYRPL